MVQNHNPFHFHCHGLVVGFAFFVPIAPMSPYIFIWDYLLPVCPLHISNYITNIIVQIFWKQQTEYNYMVLHLHNIFLDKMDNDKRLQEFREFCSAQ